MKEHYFIINYDQEGTYFDEYFDFHSACQACIDLTDLDDVDCKFSGCDIIRGVVTNLNN